LEKQKHVLIGDVLSFELEGVTFGVAHIPGESQRVLREESIRVYIYGHTHKKKIERSPNGLTVNPGSLMDNGSYLLMELPSMDISDHYIEAD
jgi:predicted phosphodiesterase